MRWRASCRAMDLSATLHCVPATVGWHTCSAGHAPQNRPRALRLGGWLQPVPGRSNCSSAAQ